MSSLLFFSFPFFSYLWSFACSTTITGLPCEVTETTGTKLPGICVPLDNNGHNLDCEALFSFLVLDVCLENYGESMQNVYLSLLHPSLILKVCLLCTNSMHIIPQRRKRVLQAAKWILRRHWIQKRLTLRGTFQ